MSAPQRELYMDHVMYRLYRKSCTKLLKIKYQRENIEKIWLMQFVILDKFVSLPEFDWEVIILVKKLISDEYNAI